MGRTEKEAKSSAFEQHGGGSVDHHHAAPKGFRHPKNRNGTLKPMRFVSLHHHSTLGSYLDGIGLPESHVRRATEINMSAIAMTEHGGVESHVQLEKHATKAGVKPLFGCEFYMVPRISDNTQKKYHLTVLARNQEGYRNLLALVSAAYSEGFYHEPTIDTNLLLRYRRGLVVLSGCQGSLLFCSAVGGKLIEEQDASLERALGVARWFRKHFGRWYFLEVQAFPELEKTRQFNPIAEVISEKLKIGIVGTLDCHYTVPEEAELQKIVHNVRPGNKRTLEDQVRDWGYNALLCPPTTDLSLWRALRATGLSKKAADQAVINTELIAQACNVTLPKLPMLRYPLPAGYTDNLALWRDWLREGWHYRGCDRLSYTERQRYKERLAYEMGLIEDKDFTDYFLVVSDSVKFAKDAGIPVGPARGSAAASLVCWLLRITEVNPMLFSNLVFERFIDVSRADLPDIDLDFDSDRRHEVREYLVSKYGEKCVNNIGTFTYYKAKLALDDVAKVHHIPKYEVETIKELLIERSSGDLRASATIEDTLQHFEAAAAVAEKYPAIRRAAELEGNIKQFGVHAAGLVVSNGDIREVCAVYEREVKGRLVQVVSMDKYDAERQGLLKLDYLGLSTMAMIAEAIRQLDMSLEELYKIPLDHPEVLKGFRENDCTGIFQFDGRATRSINAALVPDNFDEVCDIIALCRPGPLHSGAAGEYIDVKHGRKKPDRPHPALDAITEGTHYQIVYQEQILKVVTLIGGFDWTHASDIRRIISKKEGSAKFNQSWKQFRKGAMSLHKRSDFPPMTEAVAAAVWGNCITSGSYAFNASHCRSYGMLGWWSMWIKRLYPEVFYAAALSKLPSGNKIPDQHTALKRDAVEKKGIQLLPPHPVHSGQRWRGYKKKKKIRAGFEQVDGIGEKVSHLMLDYREEHKVREWKDYLKVKGIGPKTVAKMAALEALDDPFNVFRLDRRLEAVREQLEEYGLPYTTHVGSEIPYERSLDLEVVWMGVVVKRNLRDIFESHRSRTGEELDPATVKQPHLNELVVLWCYDGTEVVSVRVDRFRYPNFKEAVWSCRPEKDILLVRGVKPSWRTAREIYAHEIWVIDPEDEEE